MSPKNIVVGATYLHKNYPGVVYLGCGDYFENQERPPKRKFLIILKEDENSNKLSGRKVFSGRTDSSKMWWSNLVRTS